MDDIVILAMVVISVVAIIAYFIYVLKSSSSDRMAWHFRQIVRGRIAVPESYALIKYSTMFFSRQSWLHNKKKTMKVLNKVKKIKVPDRSTWKGAANGDREAMKFISMAYQGEATEIYTVLCLGSALLCEHLQQLCSENPDIRRRVRRLLDADILERNYKNSRPENLETLKTIAAANYVISENKGKSGKALYKPQTVKKMYKEYTDFGEPANRELDSSLDNLEKVIITFSHIFLLFILNLAMSSYWKSRETAED